MKILLIGCNGQVGWELNRTLQPLGDIIAVDYPAIDLTRPEEIRTLVRKTRPGLIINATAYTAVDKAEEQVEEAEAVNSRAPGILAQEAKALGAAIVHYSTDYVFDGTKDIPYREKDTPCPISTYGRTKWEGEQAVQTAGAPHLILRLTWVYGARGKNFMLTVLKLAAEKEEIRIVDDQIGSPSWCRMIAEATAQILAQGAGDPAGFLAEKGGLYHLSAQGKTSWFGFAQAILQHHPNRKALKVKHLIPITTNEYPTPAARPAYSLLSSEAAHRVFGLRIPEWEHSLKQVLGK